METAMTVPIEPRDLQGNDEKFVLYCYNWSSFTTQFFVFFFLFPHLLSYHLNFLETSFFLHSVTLDKSGRTLDRFTLYTPTRTYPYILSILFSIHFLCCLQGEFVLRIKMLQHYSRVITPSLVLKTARQEREKDFIKWG